MRSIYQRLVARVSSQSPNSTETPTTPTTPGRKNLSRELRVDPELQQRRQMYHCGTNFYTLDEIKKWSEVNQQAMIPARNIQLDPVVFPKKRGVGQGVESQEQSELNNNKDLTVKTEEQPTEQTPTIQPLFPHDQEINNLISFWRGDITELEIDAIVDPSNESLSGGGSGTDSIIHQAAGPELAFFNETLGGCPVGSGRLSPGFRLPSKFVISTVCPQKENEMALRSCYLSCLDIASLNKEIRSVAFSCIVAGEYVDQFEKATEIALKTIRRWLEVPFNRGKLDQIIFVVQSDLAETTYQKLLPQYFPRATDAPPSSDNSISSPANVQ